MPCSLSRQGPAGIIFQLTIRAVIRPLGLALDHLGGGLAVGQHLWLHVLCRYLDAKSCCKIAKTTAEGEAIGRERHRCYLHTSGWQELSRQSWVVAVGCVLRGCRRCCAGMLLLVDPMLKPLQIYERSY